MSDHSTYRGWSASYILGALDSAERRQFEVHLSECDECRREIAEFAPIPGLLSKLDKSEFETIPPDVTARAAARVRSDWTALDRSRRRWQWIAGVAAIVVLVMVVVTAIPSSDGDEMWTVESPMAVAGSIGLESRAWGTAVHLDLSDLPARDGYIAWVIDDRGNKQQIAVWGPTESGKAELDSTSSVRLDAMTAIAVTDLSGEERLLTASG